MAFLLRSISHSADGREIVRTSQVSDDLLKIGRDPDCDIRLNDLAVALHHATLEQVSASKIGVSAEAGLTVEIDGGNTQFGQINLAIGGTVKVGPFLLRILAAGDRQRGRRDRHRSAPTRRREDDRFDTRRFALQTRHARQARHVLGADPARARHLPGLADRLLLPASRRADRMAIGRLPRRPAVEQRPACRSAPCRARAPIAPPATSSRSSRCATPPASPATPRSTTMPPLNLMQAGAAAADRPARRPAVDRATASARRRAAASIAIPSMRARSAWCRRRSNSAPIAIPISRARLRRHRLGNASNFETAASRIPAARC